MPLTRKDQIAAEKEVLMKKEFVVKNPIFTFDHISEFYDLFILYADFRSKRADIRDVLTTARTLGLNNKYKIVYRALEEVTETYGGDQVDFETFVKDLTAKLGNVFTEGGRRAIFELLDPNQKEVLESEDIKEAADQLRYNLNDDDVKEVIQNVAGFEAKNISWERFNKFIARKIEKRNK